MLSGGTAVALSGSNTVFTDDIVDNAVYSAGVRDDNLAGGGLGGIDIKESSLTGNAHKLLYTPGGSAIHTPIGTVGPYTIKLSCGDKSSAAWTNLDLYVNGPSGTAERMFTVEGNNGGDEPFGTVPIPANQDKVIQRFAAGTGFPDPADAGSIRAAGTVMIRSGSVLYQLDLHVGIYLPGHDTCIAYGTATRAT